MPSDTAATAGKAVVRYADGSWTLAPGQEFTFGRGRAADLQLAAEPPDLRVSRIAGSLRCLPDAVLVLNRSSRGLLDLVGPQGLIRQIRSGEAVTAEPHRVFAVVLLGAYGREYRIDVDARRLPRPSGEPPQPPDEAPTLLTLPYQLTPSQRRVLAALCAPLTIAGGGGQAPATTREIGQLLGLRPNYVRNVLKEIREELTACGVPGLVGEHPGQSGDDFRLALASWAIRYGLSGEPPSPR